MDRHSYDSLSRRRRMEYLMFRERPGLDEDRMKSIISEHENMIADRETQNDVEDMDTQEGRNIRN